MKEAIKSNKKFIIIAIIIIILLLIGVAFAYLTTTLSGEKEYIIRAESLNLTLSEGNELTLEKGIPLEDEEGMKLDGFSFSLTNNGNKEADYYIYLDDLDIGNEENRIEDYSLRYSLTRNDEVFMTRNLSTMGSNPNRRVDFGTINPNETINYTLRIWIDYEATSEEASGKTFKGKLRVVSTQPVGETASKVLLENIPESNQYNDGIDTFITGEEPNNYIWYSGKLWRAVSVANEEKTVKLVTQWNVTTVPYDNDSSAFEDSYMEEWLNDTSVDGFLGNLRNYERYIKLDSKWNATMMSDTSKPPSTTIVVSAVGLLNLYEYGVNATFSNSYLDNNLYWNLLTPCDALSFYGISNTFEIVSYSVDLSYGVRPSINLNSYVKIVSGSGTEDDPYRLLGDNDELSETFLNTRFSGEYISFGTGENNLYQIVSHETRGLTKITSATPLRENGAYIRRSFGNSVYFSNENTIGSFLNNDYLNPDNGYIPESQINMIEDNSIWYLGSVGAGINYRLAKYTNEEMSEYAVSTDAKVGLLRLGELLSSQFDITSNNIIYWLITPYNFSLVRRSSNIGSSYGFSYSDIYGIKPVLNLKSNVIITSGDGTKDNPFVLSES